MDVFIAKTKNEFISKKYYHVRLLYFDQKAFSADTIDCN